MNQEKIKIEAFNEVLEIVNKYKHDRKRLSLKQKALYKNSRKIIEEYEAQEAKGQQNREKSKKDGQNQIQGADRFNQDRNTIFDTKKGQVLFELQKSYKGDERFRLDKRFAEDIDAQKLPNTLKQLTTGIDFENLSDGSDYEFKKKQSKQKKIEKKQEKQLKKTQKLNKIEMKGEKASSSDQASEDEGKKKQTEEQKDQLFGFGSIKNGVDDTNQSDSDSDFFTIKVKKDNEEEEENNKKKSSKKNLRKSSAEEQKQKPSKKKGSESSSDEQQEDEIDKLEEELQDKNDVSDSDSIQKVQFDEEDLQDDDGGKQFRKAYRIAKDYIDQEALVDEDDIQELTLEEEQHAYLKILQELMPTEKLFFQNKKKNVKVIHNKQSSYGAMLTQEEAQTVNGKKNKNKQKKVEENNQEDDNGENDNEESQQHKKKAKSGFDKEFNSDDNDDEDQFGRQKSEKSYNLVIPRFDPSQLVVKKVMQAQENEKIQKLKEQESQKKKKKMSTEAKIEAGIDKKLQKIMKANSILDKNLTEHRKLEGVEKVQKKAPVLKKLKIDSDKWKNIINETSTAQPETEKINDQIDQQHTKEQKKQSNTKQINSNTKEQQQAKPQQISRSPAQHTNHHTSLGMLFAIFQQDVNQEGQRSQFKLFG